MAETIVKAQLELEIPDWAVESKEEASEDTSLVLSDGQGRHLTEGVYELGKPQKVKFQSTKDSDNTFETLVALSGDQTIWLSQFCKKGLDPVTGKLFPMVKGPWAEGLQAANSAGKVAKYVIENPRFEIISGTRKDVKDPYTGEIKSKWCYVTK